MIKPIAEDDFRASLLRLDIQLGDTTMVSSDLTQFGVFEGKNKEETLSAITQVLMELVGPDGTVVVPTFSWDYAGRNIPFIYEETPSDTGVLSEHIRRRPDSLRSLHPIFSYTAIGARKEEVCANVSRNSYGWETPSSRMLELNAKGVALGIHPREAASIIHCAEFLFGVPYRYNKRFSTPVYMDGKEVGGEFYAFLRYRNADIKRQLEPMRSRMIEKKLFEVVPLGTSFVYSYRIRDIFNEAIALLKEDVAGLQGHEPANLPVID